MKGHFLLTWSFTEKNSLSVFKNWMKFRLLLHVFLSHSFGWSLYVITYNQIYPLFYSKFSTFWKIYIIWISSNSINNVKWKYLQYSRSVRKIYHSLIFANMAYIWISFNFYFSGKPQDLQNNTIQIPNKTFSKKVKCLFVIKI